MKSIFLHNAATWCMTVGCIMCFKGIHLLEWTKFFLAPREFYGLPSSHYLKTAEKKLHIVYLLWQESPTRSYSVGWGCQKRLKRRKQQLHHHWYLSKAVQRVQEVTLFVEHTDSAQNSWMVYRVLWGCSSFGWECSYKSDFNLEILHASCQCTTNVHSFTKVATRKVWLLTKLRRLDSVRHAMTFCWTAFIYSTASKLYNFAWSRDKPNKEYL